MKFRLIILFIVLCMNNHIYSKEINCMITNQYDCATMFFN